MKRGFSTVSTKFDKIAVYRKIISTLESKGGGGERYEKGSCPVCLGMHRVNWVDGHHRGNRCDNDPDCNRVK